MKKIIVGIGGPGEKCAQEDQCEEGGRSGRHQLEALQGLCRPAVRNSGARLQSEPETGKSSTAVENVLCGTGTKDAAPEGTQQLQPVALTSHLMKTLERLVLAHLRPLVRPSMDPLQFAYQTRIGVEDTIIYLRNRVLSHLEKPDSTVRIMFFDFSSAFNTIQPGLQGGKLERTGVDHHLTSWILDYITNRPQYVRTKDRGSDRVVCNTAGNSACSILVHPVHCGLQAQLCRLLQKLSDDSAIIGLITGNEDRAYRELIKEFVDWCQQYCLRINAGKTREMVVDFRRRSQVPPTSVNIQGMDMERVDSYKYLGVHLNNKLDWTENTDALYRKS
ncbi:uncharacterized protein LOC144592039 isoform X1 [Rhinoraja longicauda]